MSDIVPAHRRRRRAHLIEGTVTFTTTTAGAPSAVDLWTGAVTPLGEYKADAKTISVPVRIETEDTTACRFDRRAAKALSVVDTNVTRSYGWAGPVSRTTVRSPCRTCPTPLCRPADRS